MESKILPFFFFSTGLAGLGVSAVLIASRKYFSQNIFLSLCIFSLSICTVYNFCYSVGVLADLPFLFIMSKSLTYLVAPCAYLYIRNIFNPGKSGRKFDWIHFVPFIAVLVGLTNKSLQNPDAVQRALTDSSVNWFISVQHAEAYYYLSVTKSIVWLLYCFAQSLCIINFERKKSSVYNHYNYRLINWVKMFNIALIILFSFVLVQRLFNITFISIDFVNDSTMSFILMLTLGFLIFNPHILYSLEHAGINLSADNDSYHRPEELMRQQATGQIKPLFSIKKKEEYLLMLDDIMLHDKPYLRKGITVKDLSEQTNIPAHHLSYLICSEFNLHFQDFINLRRIEYLKANIEDVSWKQLTLEGICWEIGFTSRTTFFRAFIKFTGLSPSEYFTSLKKANPHSA